MRTKATSKPAAAGAERKAAFAEIKQHNGTAGLFLEGRPVSPLVADVGRKTSGEAINACTGAGIRLFRLRGADLGWNGIGQFDYAALEERLRILAQASPGCAFIIEVRVDAPSWWCKAHLDECAVTLENREQNAQTCASWASHRWRNEAGSALGRLVRHITQSQWGAHCVGWQIAAGIDGEWRHEHAKDGPDIGQRMTEQFRIWAVERYRRNTGLLRKGWFDVRAEFDRVSCPNAADRQRGDMGVLRNPNRAKRTLDYYECFFEAQNASALHFCAEVKKASGGRALVGLSYATAFETGPQPEDGHNFPEAVLDSENVDFFINRAARNGSFARALNGSIALRGKLLLQETPEKGDPARTAALALTLETGAAIPAVASPDTIRSIRQAFDRTLTLSAKVRKRISPVAVIVDLSNRHYLAEPPDQPSALNHTLLNQQLEELAKLGAPFDTYLLSDLFHPKFPDHKIFLFLNSFYLSEAERRRVDARVKRSEQTAVWLWGAGLLGEEGISALYAGRLCGQKIRTETNGISLRVRIAEANDPLTWGRHVGSNFGPERAIVPTVTVADKEITRLGANTDNKTVFSVRRFEQWTSVVFGASLVPASLLRNVLRAAGCHLYTDANAETGEHNAPMVVADSRSVGITMERGGTARLSLPGRFDVIDAWTNKAAAQNVDEFSAALAPGATGYYELRKRAAEEKTEQ